MGRWGRAAIPVVILAGAGVVSWAIAVGRPPLEPASRGSPAPLVPTLEVQPRTLPVTVATHGTIEPHTEIDLVAQVAGRVARVAFAEGERFEEGATLVELERHDAEIALRRARAMEDRARSEAQRAEARLERLEALASRNVASRAALDEARHAAESAHASVREAVATREQAETELSRTHLVSSFAGRVRTRLVDPGQFVPRGTPLLRIYAVDYAEVRLPVPLSELAYLDIPDSADAGSGSRVLLRAESAGSTARWEARLVRSGGAVDPRSRMVHVVARIDDPERRADDRAAPPVAMGLFVEATITGRTLEDVFVVPRAAIQLGEELLVLDGENRLQRRSVEIVRAREDGVLVAGELRGGDRVAVGGAASLDALEGRRVRPLPIEAEPYLPTLADGRP